jgi:hypothetical protein
VKKPKSILCDALGKGTGEMLYNALRGVDERRLASDKPRKSVSCDINACGSHFFYPAGNTETRAVWHKVPK